MKKNKQGRPRALTDEQVEEIREAWNKRNWRGYPNISQKSLAEEYGVHPLTIHNVIYEKGPYGPKVIFLSPEETREQGLDDPSGVPIGDFQGHTFYASEEDGNS